jgi:hypothetical protein
MMAAIKTAARIKPKLFRLKAIGCHPDPGDGRNAAMRNVLL